MRTPRIYTDLALDTNKTVCLETAASIHIRDVLRLKPNAKVILFNGDGCDYVGKIISLTKKLVEISIADVSAVDNESRQHIHLFQPLCRAEKMDWCVQKATELGIQLITPVICKHSNVKLAGNKIDKKINHWQSVIHSACEQSGRSLVPVINAPTTLADAINELPSHSMLRIISVPGARQSMTELSNETRKTVCLIGPEGGFSEDEVILAENHQFQPVSLGPRILRLETAVIAMLSILQATWGDLH